METADVIINGVEYDDVPSVILNTAGGGTAEFILDSGSGCNVETVTATPSSNSTSISFTGLKAEPKMFVCQLSSQITLASTYYVVSVQSDGTNTYGLYVRRSSSGGSSAYCYYSASYFSWTYSNGTLTIRTSSSSQGGYFRSGYSYRLIYAY